MFCQLRLSRGLKLGRKLSEVFPKNMSYGYNLINVETQSQTAGTGLVL